MNVGQPLLTVESQHGAQLLFRCCDGAALLASCCRDRRRADGRRRSSPGSGGGGGGDRNSRRWRRRRRNRDGLWRHVAAALSSHVGHAFPTDSRLGPCPAVSAQGPDRADRRIGDRGSRTAPRSRHTPVLRTAPTPALLLLLLLGSTLGAVRQPAISHPPAPPPLPTAFSTIQLFPFVGGPSPNRPCPGEGLVLICCDGFLPYGGEGGTVALGATSRSADRAESAD